MSVQKAPPPSPVAIVGSRDYPDLDSVRRFVRSLPEDACVISGGARGVDQAAESEAVDRRLEVWSYRPKQLATLWEIILLQNRAGQGKLVPAGVVSGRYRTFANAAHARNSMIVYRVVAEGGCLVAFYDGSSPGTTSTIQKAKDAGVLYEVFGPKHGGDAA